MSMQIYLAGFLLITTISTAKGLNALKMGFRSVLALPKTKMKFIMSEHTKPSYGMPTTNSQYIQFSISRSIKLYRVFQKQLYNFGSL
jgi:hypothetical protein